MFVGSRSLTFPAQGQCPGRYPEVSRYLGRIEEYAAQAERRGVEFTRQSLRSHLRAAGLGEARADLRAEELLGQPAVTASFETRLSLMRKWARQGQELHDYLLRVDPRVQYVAGVDGTLFENNAEGDENGEAARGVFETTRQVEELKVQMRAQRAAQPGIQ